jgi:hypothetical protein
LWGHTAPLCLYLPGALGLDSAFTDGTTSAELRLDLVLLVPSVGFEPTLDRF